MHNNHLPQFSCFENTLNSTANSYYFSNPVSEILCTDPTMLNSAFKKIESLRSKGFYLTGFVSYEASYYLHTDFKSLRYDSKKIDIPLLHFIAFKTCTLKPSYKIHETTSISACQKSKIDLIHDSLSFKDYAENFKKIFRHLEDGESYQVNYTKRINLRSSLSSYQLYEALKVQQRVAYSAFLPFSSLSILSFSPELFFKKQGEKITVKPMKGTAARHQDPQKDNEYYKFLRKDIKNKSENLIIIDLLRNDLSRICHTGSVKVINPFTIESYTSVYQMTSTICGTVDATIDFHKIIGNLFPCGSITGAPKKRTMEIIQQLEPLRNLYTGCIGYIMPNNDMCFNVAIRTMTKHNNSKLWSCGVGCGFTIQSNQYDEWQEMTTKINFIKQLYKPDFNLIETMLYDLNGLKSCDLHLERLQESARRLYFDINISQIKSSLLQYCLTIDSRLGKENYKIRIEVNHKGIFKITHQKLPTNQTNKTVTVFICPKMINSSNPLWRYKTTDKSTRGFYQEAQRLYNGENLSELIFYNEKNHITESCFYNVMIEINGIMYTPPVSDGLLPGIARKKYIDSKKVIERSISINELKNATNIYLINDLRGKITAFLNY